MADIATVFHWPPQAMDAMPVSELMAWRERARVRCGSDGA
ncbi:GpE family phage tail protein [Chitiniphilus purpureus]|uniref:GpE family phage tail protein n=1 Tax=Chitiniphilus purpureus TaxID=2981137 RepID=A0ABY6DQR8_9NEIS|nr:GpE family phage tail protein [Chitiniphilus sp. CD1]UXY16719.1 GpE family phage tail protein [Chitiniphilus sp. CD1]